MPGESQLPAYLRGTTAKERARLGELLRRMSISRSEALEIVREYGKVARRQKREEREEEEEEE